MFVEVSSVKVDHGSVYFKSTQRGREALVKALDQQAHNSGDAAEIVSIDTARRLLTGLPSTGSTVRAFVGAMRLAAAAGEPLIHNKRK